jgi:hypothetical protein
MRTTQNYTIFILATRLYKNPVAKNLLTSKKEYLLRDKIEEKSAKIYVEKTTVKRCFTSLDKKLLAAIPTKFTS